VRIVLSYTIFLLDPQELSFPLMCGRATAGLVISISVSI
jgi:hypothetical protein